MNSYVKVSAGLAAVIVVAVVGWNLLPGGSTNIGGTSTPSPLPSPSLSPSVATSATPPWDTAAGRCGENGCGGPLTAGTYSSTSLKLAVTYTLTSAWVNSRDWPDFFQLYPDTPANRALAADGAYAPYVLILPGPVVVSPSAPCAGASSPGDVEVDAAKFVDYLVSQEGLTTTEPIPVTVGGLSGQQIDVRPTADWTGCVPGTPLGQTSTANDGHRFIVLDKPDGSSLMIRLWAPAAQFDSFVASAMPVVDSFEFDLTQ